MKRLEYYPPGTSPQNYPLCDEPMGRNYRDEKVSCMLQPGHEGDHRTGINWNAHVEVTPKTLIGKSYGVDVAFRSWHDSRALAVRTREEADALLEFLRLAFDEFFRESA